MPGINDTSKPGASFITNWEIYRTGIIAADVLPDSAPHIVTFAALPVLDLSRNVNGLSNQIWIVLERSTGTGTANIAVYDEQNGSLALLALYSSVFTQATVATLATPIKVTGLLAAKYRILLPTLSATSSWKIHVAHTV